MTVSTSRLGMGLFLALSALVFGGARCVENVAVRTDESGSTYVLGEIFNDTDVQGSHMTFQATLYDAADNVIATKNVDFLCPGDLAPHSQIGFGVKFDQKNLPPHHRYEVRPIAGKALPAPVPALDLQITKSSVEWQNERDTVVFRLTVKNNGTQAATPAICSIMYDSAGKVRSVTPVDPGIFHSDYVLRPGQSTVLDYSIWGQGGDQPAKSARAIVWFPGPVGKTSSFQPIMTSALPVPN